MSCARAASVLHYTRAGHTGPPVVLLHGLGSSSADWPEQQAALEPGYRVLAVDLPGHGASPLPAGPLTVEGMAGDVAWPSGCSCWGRGR